MFNPNLRQAEEALADARLDDALELLQSPALHGHRRAPQLIGRLARALAARAKAHYLADRPIEALADCERATRLAGSLPEIAEVRCAAREQVDQQQSAQRRRNDAIAAARRLIDDGQLTAVQRVLDTLPPDSTRIAALGNDVRQRRDEMSEALCAAREALSRTDMEGAIAALTRARNLNPQNQQLSELERVVSEHLQQQILRGAAGPARPLS